MAANKRKGSTKRVEEGIYQRPSGKFVVPRWDPIKKQKVYTHPEVPKGGFNTIEEAREFKTRWQNRVASSGLTCGEFARNWTKTHPRSETTALYHDERLKWFIRDFDAIPMASVTKQIARLWIHGGPAPRELWDVVRGWGGVEQVGDDLMVPEHRQRYPSVRTMFNDAVADDLLRENPFTGLKVSRGRGRADAVMLTEEELGLLIQTATDEWGEYGETVFGPLIAVAAGTGMRPGEIRAMRRHWIDWESDEIDVKRQFQDRTKKEAPPKRESQRVLVMIPMVRAAIQKVPQRVDTDLVFYTKNGDQFRQRSHHHYWAPVRARFWEQLPPHRQEEIPAEFDFYELRHYFGSYLAALRGPAGEVLVSPQDIADQMGHKDGGKLAMKLYIHTRSEDARSRVRNAVAAAQMPPSAASGEPSA